MRINQLFLTTFFLLWASLADAQNTVLSGYITDLQNHQPLSGVVIQLDSSNIITFSNKKGFFQIKTDHSHGELKIKLIGYRPQIIYFQQPEQEFQIQLQPSPHTLNEVLVTAFGSAKTVQEASGAIAVLSSAQIKQGNGVSLQSALNSIPGVQMDQSNLADSRVSIRGNGIRSPWGMRNVKVYVNDIPLTEVDGTTRIEALDVSDLGQAVIIKGPASSLYGSGVGGVILFQLERSPYQEQSLEASAMAGSFGLSRLSMTYRGSDNRMNSFVSYGLQHYSGYRAHSSDSRKFLTANFQWFPSDNRMITFLLSRSSQDAEIPGALTATQMKENPRQAATEDLNAKAGRMQNWTRFGIGQQYRFNNKLTNNTSAFTYFYDLHHPLPFGVIRNFYQSFGGRTRFDFDPGFKKLPTTFTLGGEFDQALTKGTLFTNNQGDEGTLMSNNEFDNTFFSVFFQGEMKIGKIATLQLGIGYNGLDYNVTDFMIPQNGGLIRFRPQASPRVAVSHDFKKYLSIHGSISSGFSPPSTDQLKNADQSLNKSIQSEKGVNYELDAKGNLLHSRVDYNLSLYQMNMNGELIAQTVSQGLNIFHNSGKTTHRGVELALSWQAIRKSDGKAVTSLYPYFSMTYSDFSFKEYTILNAENEVLASYAGNELTGIAPWVINSGIMFETKWGIYANTNYYYCSKLPLNDQNTDFTSPYSLVNVKIGYKRDFGKHFGMEVFAGINNLTDAHYSSFSVLNAVGENGGLPAYYNPSPTRNGYAGFNFNYFIKKQIKK